VAFFPLSFSAVAYRPENSDEEVHAANSGDNKNILGDAVRVPQVTKPPTGVLSRHIVGVWVEVVDGAEDVHTVDMHIVNASEPHDLFFPAPIAVGLPHASCLLWYHHDIYFARQY